MHSLSKTENNGSYPWNILIDIGHGTIYYIEIADALDSSIQDTSDYFTGDDGTTNPEIGEFNFPLEHLHHYYHQTKVKKMKMEMVKGLLRLVSCGFQLYALSYSFLKPEQEENRLVVKLN